MNDWEPGKNTSIGPLPQSAFTVPGSLPVAASHK
jgi:hypothetical protein